MIEIPIWLASILVTMILAAALYNWRRIDAKVEDHMDEHDVEDKIQKDKGGIMFMVPHFELCKSVQENTIKTVISELKSTEKLLSTKIDSLEEKFDLKIDKVLLLAKNASRKSTKKT